MKNIYNYDVISGQNNLNVNTLTINQDLTLTGAPINSLLITDPNSNVIAFTNGPANYILAIDPLLIKPSWTNDIIVDRVQTNSMKIFGTQEGDILQVSNGDIARVAIGTTGQILTVGDTNNVQWQDLILPDPLSIQDLTLTTSLHINFGTGGKLFVDSNSKIVYSELTQNYQDNNSTNYTDIGLIVLSTYFSFSTVSGRKYCLSCNFGNGNSVPNISFINMKIGNTVIKSCSKYYAIIGLNDNIHFQYVFTANTTGLITVSLEGQTSTGQNTASNFTWLLSPLGN